MASQSLLFQNFLHYEQYLGLPSLVGRSKKTSFDYIKERTWRKLQGWKEKLLSQVGRDILIKAVVQAIPAYTMSCFKLPLRLCNDIEKLICKFWWGQRGDRQKIHWVKWEDMCNPNLKRVWGLKNWLSLIMLFWLSKHGGCCPTKTHCYIEFSSLNSSQIARWWRPKIHRWVLRHGEASLRKEM